MKYDRPQFELARVYSDGSQDEPEIVSVARMPWDTKMSRRGALGVGLTVTGVLMLLGGCDDNNIFLTHTVKETDIQDSPDVERKSPANVLKAHQQSIAQLYFSSDSATLVSSSLDYTVKQWSVPDGKLLGTVKETSLRPSSLKITPDGKILVGELGSEVAFWSLPEGKSLKKISDGTATLGYGTNFAMTPDGKVLAVKSGKNIKLYTVPEGELLTTLPGGEFDNVWLLTFAPNGKILVSGASNKNLKLWSVPDGNLLGELSESQLLNNFTPYFIDPESKIFALLRGGQLKLWSLPDGSPIEIKNNSEVIQSPFLTPDGKTLVTLARYYPTPGIQSSSPGDPYQVPTPFDSTAIKLWSFPELVPLTVGKTKSSESLPYVDGSNTTKIAATPDGKMLGVVLNTGTSVWLLTLPDLKLESTLKGTMNPINSFAISPDGKFLAVGDNGGTIMLWDLEKKEFLSFLFDKIANEKSVKGISYNVKDKVTGRTISYTLPCGSPIPPGAVCTCNCVPGTYTPYTPPAPKPRKRKPRTGGGSFSYCTCNKICTCIPVPSDRDVKESFETTNPLAILQKLSELTINKWNYKWDDESIRHIGPMAQDFAEAFAVGDSNKHIHPVDAQGVAFAAIQGLYQILKDKDSKTENLKRQLEIQRDENKQLKSRVENLERLLNEVAAKSSESLSWKMTL